MKQMFACLMILTTLGAIPAMAATTLTGVITDDMCGRKHMMEGKSDAECTHACVKSGAKLAMLSDGKVYVLAGNTSEVSALAGKKVTVSGELKGSTMNVTSVAAAK